LIIDLILKVKTDPPPEVRKGKRDGKYIEFITKVGNLIRDILNPRLLLQK